MGVACLILGESGNGKSASLRNIPEDQILVINVADKPLPFKNHMESLSSDNYPDIIKEMKLTKKKEFRPMPQAWAKGIFAYRAIIRVPITATRMEAT